MIKKLKDRLSSKGLNIEEVFEGIFKANQDPDITGVSSSELHAGLRLRTKDPEITSDGVIYTITFDCKTDTTRFHVMNSDDEVSRLTIDELLEMFHL